MTASLTSPRRPTLRRAASLATVCLALFLSACATPRGEIDPPSPPETDDVSDIVAAAETAASAAAAQRPRAATAAASAPEPAASAASSADGNDNADGAAVAAPIDPLRPDEKVDLDTSASAMDLWDRLRRGFAMPDIATPLVTNREQWYATRPDYVQRMTTRGGRYLFHILEEVERRGMPTELALLPFIESAFNPQALSSAKASGMWQFMPATGKDFELRQNIFRDDRRDVLASTRAALDYLGRLYSMFGDWQLALAAYNWGEGSVQRAINRNRRAGLPTDYLSLRMPEETQYYLPKLQAVKNIVSHPEAYGLTLPPLENHPYFLSVPIERDIDVALAIELSGVRREEFMTLNPQMKKPVILAAGTPQVLLPYKNASQFVANVHSHRGPLASWTAWVAPRTLHPSDAAHQHNISEAELRQVNAIPPAMLIKAGSALLVPRRRQTQEDVSPHLADNAMMNLTPDVPPLKRITLKAGRRDSVATVARRYRISPAQVAHWNNTQAHSKFKPGQSIVVFVPNKKASASRHSSKVRHAVAAARADSAARERTREKASVKSSRSSAKKSSGKKTAAASSRKGRESGSKSSAPKRASSKQKRH